MCYTIIKNCFYSIKNGEIFANIVIMIYEPILDVKQHVSKKLYKNSSAITHFHQSIELIYCHEGKLKIGCGADNYEIKKDEIAFCPSYFPHSVEPLENSLSTTYIIPYSYFKPFSDNKIFLLYKKLNNVAINKKILSAIEDSSAALIHQPNLLLQGYVNVILGLISENYESADFGSVKIELMMKIIDYINENSKEKITLDSLSKHFGYSKYYFSRLFNKTFNCTLNFYINQVRKNKVLSELNSDKKITDIILDNGFGTVSTFYRTHVESVDRANTEILE